LAKDGLKRAQIGPGGGAAVPITPLTPAQLPGVLKTLGKPAAKWARSMGFAAKPGEVLSLPGDDGTLSAVLFGIAPEDACDRDRLVSGKLPRTLAPGRYRLEEGADPFDFALGWALGAYRFGRYKRSSDKGQAVLALPGGVDAGMLKGIIDGVTLARDLVNTPASDMGPVELERAARALARAHGARTSVTTGDQLLKKGFPMIHAVGRASDRPPRLIDIVWGKPSHPKVTLVGKGVCFDTGGLNLKPGGSMALMKKDMGGAANVLGLASMIMAAKLKLRLRVLIPAVDNNVSANAYRPGDVLSSRKGLTVEIGNTDAEGRLVLADALALADEQTPDLLIDMATLTGAARVALGPELPPFYTDDEKAAEAIAAHSRRTADPVWRLPLWRPYDSWLDSKIADVNHITASGFAGSMTAALFLDRFVEKAKTYAHFDIYAWAPKDRPAGRAGGEAQAIRALFSWLGERYG